MMNCSFDKTLMGGKYTASSSYSVVNYLQLICMIYYKNIKIDNVYQRILELIS